jgi:hypothetical protein
MTKTERTIQLICRAVIAIVFAIPVYLGARHGLLDLQRNPVLESAMAGAFLIHMRARPKPAEWLSALGLGSVFTIAYAWWHHGYGDSWEAAPFAYATFLGLGSLIVLMVQLFLGTRATRQLHRDTFFAAAAFAYFSFILAFYLNWTATLQQRTFDLSLYAFDESLQCRPSALIGSLMAQTPVLAAVASLVYRSLPLAICFLVAVEREAPGRFPARILPLFVAVGLAGASLHNLFPALGPHYFFGADFPAHLPPLSSLVLEPGARIDIARSAMPSVQFAFALLIWWNAARLARGWRWLAAAVVILTFLASLGFGGHYFVDIVVAVPLAVAVQAFALRIRSWASLERRMAFWGGVSLTLAWIVALRFGLFLDTPVLSWSAVVGTLALALWWNRGIERGHRCLEQQVLTVRPVALPQEP